MALLGGGLALVLVAGLALVIGVATRGSQLPEAGTGRDVPPPATTTETTQPNQPTERIQPTGPTEPPSPTATSSAEGVPPSPSTTPPGLQEPSPTPVHLLARNPLVTDEQVALSPRTCQLPIWSDTPAAAEAYFRAAATCLDRSWGSALAHFALPFSPPELRFPQGSRTYPTSCGRKDVEVAAAFYCDGVIYLPFAGLQTDFYDNQPAVHLSLMAHEYGHHVQQLAGILPESTDREVRAGPSTPAGLRYNRRMELQAQCFAGIFFRAHAGRGSISNEMLLEAETDQGRRGDWSGQSRDHGTPQHYQSWWQRGAERGSPADCNTYAAPAGDVS
ncbi:neutral zinc metallopeptidase [Nocardioides insulae]|uniref:neutral zinc metallopeptidase n=1 Tax=Nocardioides insulae TaxID=394734 RepID=UPI00041D3400|nr:neutral zinc metallopeptidase [Nocardioides insulae]